MTLKQILARIEALATNHPQINHFFVGAADEFLDDADVVWPAFFCELQPSATIDAEARLCTYNFKIYLFTQIYTQTEQDLWEATSDMSSIAQDFIALLTDPTYTDWITNTDFVITVDEYKLQDLCAGVTFNIQISSWYDANRCQVPATYNWDLIDSDGEFTLKQILTRCEDLALSHSMVNDYRIGKFHKIVDSGDILYPLVYNEFGNSGRINAEENLTSYDFTFHFFDQMETQTLANEFEVKSDMMQLAGDFAAMLLSNSFKWVVDSTFSVTIQDYKIQDLTAGISLQATISGWFNSNRCQVPSVEEVGNFIIWNDTDKILVSDTEKLLYA